MGYAALGTPRPEMVKALRSHVLNQDAGVYGWKVKDPPDKYTEIDVIVGDLVQAADEEYAILYGDDDGDSDESLSHDPPPTHPGLTRARRQAERDLAASAQAALSENVVGFIARGMVNGLVPSALRGAPALDVANISKADGRDLGATVAARVGIDGIALSGGGALNVLLNQRILEWFGLPVHVPSAPADEGLAVGLAWLIQPPPLVSREK